MLTKRGHACLRRFPDGVTEAVLTSIDLTFNEPLDPASFTKQDVTLLDPETVAALESYDPDAIVDGFAVRGVAAKAAFSNIDQAEAVLSDPEAIGRAAQETASGD